MGGGVRKGGSNNPIVFNDYESYVAKFNHKEKTTDDTYTPRDVYEAVVKYVGEIYDLTDKVILRPFYPGGDYENAECVDCCSKYLGLLLSLPTSTVRICAY